MNEHPSSEPTANNKPDVSAETAEDWLRQHVDPSVNGVEALGGGFWSTAFAYKLGGDDYVLRFNNSSEGFEIDRAAHDFAATGLPVPEVTETGAALGVYYAISRRHFGKFLEDVTTEDVPRLRDSLGGMFKQMRQVPAAGNVEWYDTGSRISWHDYLLRAISDDTGSHTDGWRGLMESHPETEELYKEACIRIHKLLPLCPERRDLVHGDLLHQNVLVSEDANEIRALFSWKCSAFGDFLYDIAWCTHWSPWHPGIEALDVYDLTLNADDLDNVARENMAERHHCYELQIAASHIGWYLWTRDEENLNMLTSALNKILDRGPLA